jgi:hypothetical protein
MNWYVFYERWLLKLLNWGHIQGMLQDVLKHKLVFIETPDAAETSLALENYRKVWLLFQL